MRKLVRDPLVHFLVIGAILFVVLTWRSDETDPQEIRLSATQVRTALQTLLPGERPANLSDLEALIEPLIRDEVFYREALALGLDVDDDEVRTRLIEKMRYISEDLADPEPASDGLLREFFAADPARFAMPETVSFDHLFFSPRQRGDAVRADAQATLEALRNGVDIEGQGDTTPLGEEFLGATRDRMIILFGEEMTAAVFSSAVGEWAGPLESEFGLHLVRVSSRRAERQPQFDEVEERVREEYAADQRTRRNDEVWATLSERYNVVVDWPEELVAE